MHPLPPQLDCENAKSTVIGVGRDSSLCSISQFVGQSPRAVVDQRPGGSVPCLGVQREHMHSVSEATPVLQEKLRSAHWESFLLWAKNLLRPRLQTQNPRT